MHNREFLVDSPGRRDKAFKPGLSRLKRDIWYAYTNFMMEESMPAKNKSFSALCAIEQGIL